jgi:flavorubredoxin
MTAVTEIAPDIFRICTYIGEVGAQFNQFLVLDREPLLYHTGLKKMFPLVREAIAKLADPAALRWIGFSHFESDECGALNEFLAIAPGAQPLCSFVGAMVSLNDFALRPARGLQDGEVLTTGARGAIRQLPTVHTDDGTPTHSACGFKTPGSCRNAWFDICR